VGHFLAFGPVPGCSSPCFTLQTGHGEGWDCLGVVSAEPSDQRAPEIERESSEIRGRGDDLEREGWGEITVEGEACDMTCRSPGMCEDIHPACARG
jgi:hypothetical protein